MSFGVGSGPSILCVPCAPGPLRWVPPASLSSRLWPSPGPAQQGFRKEMLSLGHDLPTFGLLLWTSIPCYPALWGGPHSPVPAFDKRIEKLLITPLRSHPIPEGLSAPPSLRPPNSASILAVLNRCLLLTKNEEMDAKKHRNMFLTGAEWVAGGRSRTGEQRFGFSNPYCLLWASFSPSGAGLA